MADTIRTPGGAGIVRVHGTDKALAFTSDVTPRYVRANPVEGGKQAVAEAFRNLCAVGAKPLATTDNLNFGNPEKPEIMGQFVGAIKGIGRPAALDMPIVSGNVSLYNETDGQAILPTPTIGAVGLIDDPRPDDRRHDPRRPCGCCWWARRRATWASPPCCGRSSTARRATRPMWISTPSGATAISSAPTRAWINACTDLSDGGLALAAFEMAVAGGCGRSRSTPPIRRRSSARIRAAT
jgi:phosphoribosylformylglycinamidine (FGAM) synthase-like enzyme